VSAWRDCEMGEDRIRYLVFVCGRWRWRPTASMRRHGFELVTMGRGGPGLDSKGRPVPSPADKTRAITLNADWDRVRTGAQEAAEKVYPPGSLGEAYKRAMLLRAAERKKKRIVWTKEQESRDDWPRAWKWLEPVFGDVDPKTLRPEDFLTIDRQGNVSGLMAVVEMRVSVTERHRVIKVWRALWKRMAAMSYCKMDSDPSLSIANSAPQPRQATWQHQEVLKRVQMAWRMGYKGLAACIAVGWDSMLSPVDARTLSLGQLRRYDNGAIYFELDRAKTGRAAAGTLSQWSLAILTTYVDDLKHQGVDLLDTDQIFRTPGTVSGPKGGRRWLPQPYTKNTLSKDFRPVRAELAKDDERQIQDMRRSGAVEGMAGGATPSDMSNKMANTLMASTRLQKTYTPVNVASVLRFDEARQRGRRREQKPVKSVITTKNRVS
jgi:hypothetical protein